MKSQYRQVLNLILVTVVSAGLIAGMDAIGALRERERSHKEQLEVFRDLLPAVSYEPLDVDGQFKQARSVLAFHTAFSKEDKALGYLVEVNVPGYASDLSVQAAIDQTGTTILGIRVRAAGESSATGGQVALPFFYSQFSGKTAPLYLQGEAPQAVPEPRKLRDGAYSAEESVPDPATGYRYIFQMTVTGGRITDALWDGVRADGGKPLRKASEDGEIVAAAGELPWHEQAIAIEALLMQLGDPAFIKLNTDGTTDNAQGVSMPVAFFISLAEQCVAKAAVPSGLSGSMKDGVFRAQAGQIDPGTGFRDYVEMTIENKKVVAVVWDGVNKDGVLRSKASKDAKPVEGSLPWHEQAAAMAAFLLAVQDPTVVTVDADGRASEAAGVDTPVKEFLGLARSCMLQAGMVAVSEPDPAPSIGSGLVDAVAGATISSRAVVKAANLAVEYVQWVLAADAAEKS